MNTGKYCTNADREDDEDYTGTGIYVRATNSKAEVVNADLAQLDQESLLRWLRSRGGENRWAEQTVGILLGYPNLLDGQD